MTSFSTHMQNLAREFIGTVLFVDDKITNDVIEQHPPTEQDELNDAEMLVEPQDNHILNLNKLSSFSLNNMLCCPFCIDPISTQEAQSNTVDSVCKLSKKADVLVLDWKMEDEGGPVGVGTTARGIIECLSGSPYSDRTILVCIFSAENEENINAHDLCKKNVHVFYENKNTPESYENLPIQIVKKFSEKHSGLLTGAALSAIKVIRDNTHRIISYYSASHDAAYLSHRSTIHKPEDAEIFATEMIAASFNDLIRGNDNVSRNLNINVLKQWFESKNQLLLNNTFETTFDGTSVRETIDNNIKISWMEKGFLNWINDLLNKTKQDNNELKESIGDWDKKSAKSLIPFFHDQKNISEKDSFNLEAEFAKLALHAILDITVSNKAFFLSLGTILKATDKSYYLCIQPICDSVRLDESKDYQFIFLKLENKGASKKLYLRKGFNIVVTDNNKNSFLSITDKISKICVFSFKPTPENDRVLISNDITIAGTDNKSSQIEFSFLAQIRQDQAHRIANNFLHRITRVGLDESEWLRRHSTVN